MILVIELTVFTAIAAIIGFIFWYSKFVDANTQNANEIASNSGDDSLSIIMQGIEAVENMLELKEQTDLSDTGPHKRCYNILLLGESGTGKSTMINALANYVRFESFDEAAQANDFTQLIPCKFTLTHPLTGQPLVIEYGGKDSNERTSGPQGHSSTQSPRGYEFLLDDQQNPIRLIDTPGIGDAGGIDLDRRNFDKIFDYLKNGINQLHAVLIQMKSTDITPRVRIIGPKCTAMTLLLQDRVGCAESNGTTHIVVLPLVPAEIQHFQNVKISVFQSNFCF